MRRRMIRNRNRNRNRNRTTSRRRREGNPKVRDRDGRRIRSENDSRILVRAPVRETTRESRRRGTRTREGGNDSGVIGPSRARRVSSTPSPRIFSAITPNMRYHSESSPSLQIVTPNRHSKSLKISSTVRTLARPSASTRLLADVNLAVGLVFAVVAAVARAYADDRFASSRGVARGRSARRNSDTARTLPAAPGAAPFARDASVSSSNATSNAFAFPGKSRRSSRADRERVPVP